MIGTISPAVASLMNTARGGALGRPGGCFILKFVDRRSSIVNVFNFGGDAQCIPRKLTGDHKATNVISLLNER